MVMKGKDEKHQIQSGGSKSKRKYKGVRMRSWGSWVSEIRAPNQKTRIWLGSYSTAEAAARAYDAALLCLKGSSAANLNFPLLAAPSSFAIPTTDDAAAALSPKSIQRVAAAAAANSFQEEAASGATAVPITSLSPSPSSSSSASDQLDDDAAALRPSPSDHVAAWFDGIDGLQSPKYDVDLLYNGGGFFSPPAFEDFYEEGEIGLWSFC